MQPTSPWREDKTHTLPDGRTLGYRTHGDAEALPLFLMHGTPGSRFCLSEIDLLTQVPGLLLVIADRPGYGLSSPQPKRSIVGWADDIHALAGALGLRRYWVAGVSGGAPHALTCAARHPEAVQAAYLLCSPAPKELGASRAGLDLGNRIAFFLSRHWPGLLQRIGAATAAACLRDPEGFLEKAHAQLPKSDQQVMAAKPMRAAMARDLQEAYRQGPAGFMGDMTALYGTDSWGIRYAELRVPVLLWHGDEDTLAPLSMAKALHRAIPGSQLQVLPGRGHFLTEEPLVVQAIGSHMGLTAVPSAPGAALPADGRS